MRHVGHPARTCHVARVAAAVDQDSQRKQGGDPAEIERVLRHLVHDPESGAAHRFQRAFMALGQRPNGLLVDMRDAVQWRCVSAGGLGKQVEDVSDQPQLTSPENGRVACQDLLDQSRS